MYGSDVKKGKVLIGLMPVANNEKSSTWNMFLELVSKSIESLCDGKKIITDQDRGALSALERVMPHACPFFCTKNRMDNVLKQTDGTTEKAFAQCIHSYNTEYLFFGNAVDDSERSRYVDIVPETMQFPLKRGNLYARITTQGVESMNNANLRMRNMGLILDSSKQSLKINPVMWPLLHWQTMCTSIALLLVLRKALQTSLQDHLLGCYVVSF